MTNCKHDNVQYDENGGRCADCGAYFHQDEELDYIYCHTDETDIDDE